MIYNDSKTVSLPRFRRDQLRRQQRRDRRPVIVALDGSSTAEQAIPFAQALANHWHAPLRLLHVRNPVDESFGRDLCMVDDSKTLTLHSRPGVYLRGLAESLRASTNSSVESRTISGVSIANTLCSACASGARALVLVRTQRSALSRFFCGSVVDELIGQLSVPLLVVPTSQEGGWTPAAPKTDFTRPIACLDGSDAFGNLLRDTVAIAPDGAVCQLLRLLPLASVFRAGRGEFLPTSNPRSDAWTELFKARDVLEQQGIRGKPHLVFHGQSAPSAIVDRVKATQANLIVMAARPRLLPWWLRDAVIENVIRRVSVPVLVVPGGEDSHSLSTSSHVTSGETKMNCEESRIQDTTRRFLRA